MEKRLKHIDSVIQNGKYKDTWASLQTYRVPEWYHDAKFGVFIHWGVYSVPAFGNEWYSRNMYIQGSREFEHHIRTYGAHKDFGYKDFIPMFKAERFDPSAWAELFKSAGAQYVVPVAEHHDGFQMYKSELSRWNAAEMGPCRDVLGELRREVEKAGLIFGASSHRVEHWFFMGHGREFESDIHEPLRRGDFYWPAEKEAAHHDIFSKPEPTEEFMNDWLCRCCELVDRYRPKIIYFDWWIQHTAVEPYLKRFAAYYYDRAEEWGGGVINYKHDAFAFGAAVPDIERGQLAEAKPYVWQTDTAAAKNSWCYTENNDYKTPEQILCDLVDIVSKNGRLLLNIGPRADGTIPDEDRAILEAIGAWLRVNGEAIYSSKPWRRYGEGSTEITEGQFADSEAKAFTKEDIRFTAGNGCIYAAVLCMNGESEVTVRSLAETADANKPEFSGRIRTVTRLGCDTAPEWRRDGGGLHIKTETVTSAAPVVFKIET